MPSGNFVGASPMYTATRDGARALGRVMHSEAEPERSPVRLMHREENYRNMPLIKHSLLIGCVDEFPGLTVFEIAEKCKCSPLTAGRALHFYLRPRGKVHQRGGVWYPGRGARGE